MRSWRGMGARRVKIEMRWNWVGNIDTSYLADQGSGKMIRRCQITCNSPGCVPRFYIHSPPPSPQSNLTPTLLPGSRISSSRYSLLLGPNIGLFHSSAWLSKPSVESLFWSVSYRTFLITSYPSGPFRCQLDCRLHGSVRDRGLEQ